VPLIDQLLGPLRVFDITMLTQKVYESTPIEESRTEPRQRLKDLNMYLQVSIDQSIGRTGLPDLNFPGWNRPLGTFHYRAMNVFGTGAWKPENHHLLREVFRDTAVLPPLDLICGE
jgi:hypothetical protein